MKIEPLKFFPLYGILCIIECLKTMEIRLFQWFYLLQYIYIANLEHALCVSDSEVNRLEGQLDDLQRQLTEIQSQLTEKEQLLVIAKDAIKQNEVIAL